MHSRHAYLPSLLALTLLAPAAPPAMAQGPVPIIHEPATVLERVAMGSCLRQNRAQPIWEAVLAAQPDAFIFMGDNIYADTDDRARFQAAYDELGNSPGFQRLRAQVPVLATWDDHDYGINDGGASWRFKEEAEELFLNFFQDAADSPRRERPGVYGHYVFGPEGKRTQVIVLDTRYFRSDLKVLPAARQTKRTGKYAPLREAGATMLGDAQWRWLEEVLRQPADLRLIVSSIQILPTDQIYEKWSNIPRERARLLGLLKTHNQSPVLLLSGDRHLSEFTRVAANDRDGIGYPLHEMTSSGMTHSAGNFLADEVNTRRMTDAPVLDKSFGLISINWEVPDPQVKLTLRGVEGEAQQEQTLTFSQMGP